MAATSEDDEDRVEIVEPPLGFGRDITISAARASDPLVRGALTTLVVAVGCFVGGHFVEPTHRGDSRGVVLQGCGVLLGLATFYFFGLVVRHRGRDDLVVRLDRVLLDVPLLTFSGPMRFTERLGDIQHLALMTGRAGMWIDVRSASGPKAIIPAAWLEGHEGIVSFYARLELRVAMARRLGKVPRATLVGTEAMALLGTRTDPVFGVVVGKPASKRPVVLATVRSFEEFFARLSEWPDAKLVVASDARERFVEGLAALGDEIASERRDRLG